MSRVRVWLQAAGISKGPIFCAVNKGGVVGDRLDAGSMSRILKKLAPAADLDPAEVSGHSCRVGMAQDLVADGEDVAGLMQSGRWSSAAMPARYTARQEATRGAVARFHARRHRE